LSLYLELPVYDQLREIAHVERTKMHQLVVEGIDLLFRKRGQPPIRELMKKTNQG
jgi:predicted DNA-binding ribbon-helix-helix protein